METVKEKQQRLLKAYRQAVCAFENNPTDKAIERIASLQQQLKDTGYPITGLFT